MKIFILSKAKNLQKKQWINDDFRRFQPARDVFKRLSFSMQSTLRIFDTKAKSPKQ